jgi:hypothetical protein
LYVGHIRSFNDNISELYGVNYTSSIYKLLEISQKIQNDLKPDPKHSTSGLVQTIVYLIRAGGAVAPGTAGPVLGLVGTTVSFSANLANNRVGDNEVIDISTTVANLLNQAVESFKQQQNTLGTMFRFIYQDRGKIEALGSKLNSSPPEWTWAGNSTTGKILDQMTQMVEVSYYRSIPPTVYAVGQIHKLPSRDGRPPSPHDYVSSRFLAIQNYCIPWHAFKDYGPDKPEQYLSSEEDVIDLPNLWHVQPLGRRDIADGGCGGTIYKDNYRSLSEKILDHLFNDLAVYKPYFYRRWEFPHAACDARGVDPDYDKSTGCDWKGAKPIGPALTAVIAPDSTDSPQLKPQASTSLGTEEASMSPSAEASALSYSWQVLGGEATISDGDTATPTVEFTSGPGTYVVRVTVTDSDGRASVGETTVRYAEQ